MVNGRPVCDDDFTLVNADVACKQLGFIGAVSFTKESRYGRTSPEFAMDQVRCDGTEERLLDCSHSKVCKQITNMFMSNINIIQHCLKSTEKYLLLR